MKLSKNVREQDVINWSKERMIDSYDSRFIQLAKVMEELGELSKAMIEDDFNGIVDALGDVNVTLIVLANQMELLLSDCLEVAYDEIKNRKGVLKNGSFIKNVEKK